ncbi:MAG: hypothetical protein HDR84_08280 [Bacteroides sp.]|nr:hypothetical protein [Bacteroides sp.]
MDSLIYHYMRIRKVTFIRSDCRDAILRVRVWKTVEAHIKNIPKYYRDVELVNHVVMPNHIHIVLSVGTPAMPTVGQSATPKYGCLGNRDFMNILSEVSEPLII